MIYDVIIDGKNYRLELERADAGWRCRLDGREVPVDAMLARPDVLSVLIEGKAYEIKRERTATDLHLWVGGVRYAAEMRDPRSLRSRKGGAGDDTGPQETDRAHAGQSDPHSASGKGESRAGQGILVMEAMKMQNEIKSPQKGTIQKILAAEGANVNAGDVLAIVE